MKGKRIVLQPEYMKEFKCIGQECEDSCCIGWKIDLDKETYLKYKKVKNNELKLVLNKSINRNRSSKNNEMYGKINLNKDLACPLLDGKKLCIVHGTLGEEFLSNVCATYPRALRVIDGKYERSATMSCPEIARLALFNPKGISFEHIEEDDKTRIRVDAIFNSQANQFQNKIEAYFWDIRLFSLSLLQNRSYSLSERLIILGIVYKKIELLQENKQINNISKVLEDMSIIIEEGILRDDIRKIPVNTQLQLILTKEMTDEKISEGINSSRYIECLKEFLTGLNCIDEVNYEVMLEKYDYNYKNYAEPYLNEKEYVIENYLVNEYFKEEMPFGSYESIWDSYIFLCVNYSLIKLHLIGLSGYYKELNDDIILKLIQSFSKVVLHSDSYIKNIIKIIKKNGYDTLAYMSILVKN